MRRWRYIIPAGAIVVLLGMIFAKPSGALAFLNPSSNRTADHPEREGADGTGVDEAKAGPASTKRSLRDMGRKPTEEETRDLLEATIVPEIRIDDATLEETMAELNQIARDCGIPARELTFSIDRRASHLRVRELRIRNVPLIIIIKYVCDSSLTCRVSPGRVLIGRHRDLFEESVPAEEEPSDPDHDPFAGPDEDVRVEDKQADPDDPFAD